jgi:hypothetical protein
VSSLLLATVFLLNLLNVLVQIANKMVLQKKHIFSAVETVLLSCLKSLKCAADRISATTVYNLWHCP